MTWRCTDTYGGKEYTVVADLDPLPPAFTVYGAQVRDGGNELLIDEGSQVYVHLDSSVLSPHVVEIFAGTGSMGQGAKFLGAQIEASLDFNQLSATTLKGISAERSFWPRWKTKEPSGTSMSSSTGNNVRCWPDAHANRSAARVSSKG